MKLIAVKLDDQLMELLDEAARQQDIPKSQLVRDALAHYLIDLLKMDKCGPETDGRGVKIVC